MRLWIFALIFAVCLAADAAPVAKAQPRGILKLTTAPASEGHLIFDLPVAYNDRVQYWIKYFQNEGRGFFSVWLERSYRTIPQIQRILVKENLPKDLAYVAMIESGFSNRAISHAGAVGPWQFIQETGKRYGLKKNWWLDERRDLEKSTHAAAKYFRFLYRTFGSWYLAAAGYNAGENRIARMTRKHGTKNFWVLSRRDGFADETKNYVPKLIAAMLIAKAPNLYGFRDLTPEKSIPIEYFHAPPGLTLKDLADYIGIPRAKFQELNPELILGLVPPTVSGHRIRIPKGTREQVSAYVRYNYISQSD